MEVVGPDVDDWLIGFVQNHVFARKDFYEKRDGGIRLTPKITPILAETISIWSENIEAVINHGEGILLNRESIDKIRHRKKSRK